MKLAHHVSTSLRGGSSSRKYRENAKLWIGGDGDLFTGVKAVFALFRGGVESVEEP